MVNAGDDVNSLLEDQPVYIYIHIHIVSACTFVLNEFLWKYEKWQQIRTQGYEIKHTNSSYLHDQALPLYNQYIKRNKTTKVPI